MYASEHDTFTKESSGLLRIGQIAQLNNISEKALRIYQTKGILKPVYIDDESGYRYYSLSQCSTIDMVSQLQSIGLSLDQIADIVAAKDVHVLRDCVQRRLDVYERRDRQVQLARQISNDIINSCDLYLNKPPCNQPMLKALPDRTVLTFPLTRKESDPREDWQSVMDQWEIDLRSVRREILHRGWPLSLFRNVGCLIEQADLMNRRLTYSSAFVSVSPAFGEEVFSHAITIKGGVYITEYIDSVQTEDGRERETVELLHLLDECNKRGLEPAGPYVGEVIADGPAFLFNGREMMFKMCLPVQLVGQHT